MSDTTLNQFVASGTAAEMALFTPSPPTVAAGPDSGYFWYQTDTGATYSWDGAAWQVVGAGAAEVTAAAVIADNAIVRGDGGAKGVQDSAVVIEDDGRMTTVTDPTGLQDAATKNYVDTQIAGVNVGGATQNSFLISGGQVVWQTGYEFLVSAAQYYIDGVLYTSAETTITLDAADPSDDRIDVIAVDDSSTVVKITGTASTPPSEPQIDPATQLKLTIILVETGTTAPSTETSELLYADNAGSPTEWDWTTSGSGFDVNSTNNPRSPSTKDIEGTAVTNNSYAQGQIGSGTLDPNNFTFLVMYIRSKAAWANKRVLVVQLQNAGVLTGSGITIKTGTFGFDSSQTASYQQVAIPVSQFAVPAGNVIDQIRIRDSGGSIGFYIDDISFQGGVTQSGSQGITQEQADARYALLTEPFATVAATTALPNARRLLAGTNLTFDDTVAGQRTLNASGAASPSILTLLTADPVSPTDDTGWLVREGTSPTMTVSVKVRISGATYTVAAITL